MPKISVPSKQCHLCADIFRYGENLYNHLKTEHFLDHKEAYPIVFPNPQKRRRLKYE